MYLKLKSWKLFSGKRLIQLSSGRKVIQRVLKLIDLIKKHLGCLNSSPWRLHSETYMYKGKAQLEPPVCSQRGHFQRFLQVGVSATVDRNTWIFRYIHREKWDILAEYIILSYFVAKGNKVFLQGQVTEKSSASGRQGAQAATEQGRQNVN